MAPWLYKLLGATQYVCTLAVTFSAACIKTTPSEWGFASSTIAFVQAYAWILISTLTLLAGVSKIMRDVYGPPWVWEAIRKILTRFRAEAFTGIDGDKEHYHRATLFKRCRFCFRVRPWRHRWCPWGLRRGPMAGWMWPVARSGVATQ